MKHFSFPFRVSIYSFLLSLACMLAIIYTEDFLIFQDIYEQTNYIPNPEVYFGRILLAIGLSFAFSTILYVLLTVFVVKLHDFRNMILETARNYIPEYDLSLDSGFLEINQMKEVFKNSMYALESKFSARVVNVIHENNKNLNREILPFTHKLKIPKFQGWDIALYPLENYDPQNDYLDYFQTKNGMICIMAGFSEHTPLQIAYKARIQTLFTLAKEFYFYTEEDLISSLQTTIRLNKIKGLNLTLFFICFEKKQIKFLHFQENPIFLFRNSELIEIPTIGETEYPFMEENSDLRYQNLQQGDYLIFITDRILDKPYFEKDILTAQWKVSIQKTKLFSAHKIAQNLTEFLDSKLHEKGTKDRLGDYLSYIIVGNVQ
ncbi:MAG: hypothetical protein N3A69_07745 [Leptospiraceae bacterium]|nr:hypothetical protein [Leptospiraceae bacterium]